MFICSLSSLFCLYFFKSSIKAKQLCVLLVTSMLSKEPLQNEKLEKLATDAKLDMSDVKACVALVEFVMKSAARHGCNGETLSSELQQLGLPKEHATALCRVYDDSQTKLEDLLRDSSLKCKQVKNSSSCVERNKALFYFQVTSLKDVSWRIDYIFGSSYLQVNAKRQNFTTRGDLLLFLCY